jgi:hypothetical protein
MSSPLPSEEKSVERLIASAMSLCAQVKHSVSSLNWTAHLAEYTLAEGRSDDAANLRNDYSFILASTREDLENANQRIIEVKTLLGDEVSSHLEDIEKVNARTNPLDPTQTLQGEHSLHPI